MTCVLLHGKKKKKLKKENHFMLKLGSYPEQSKFYTANLPQRPKINNFLFGCREKQLKNLKSIQNENFLLFPLQIVTNEIQKITKKNNSSVYGFDTKSFIAKVFYPFCLFH